jgi:signal transduction histidine kinase
MESSRSAAELKLRLIMQAAPLALIEISDDGSITDLNLKGEATLKFITGEDIQAGQNLLEILDHISPRIQQDIVGYAQSAGVIIDNEIYTFLGAEQSVKYFQFTVAKMFSNCIMVTINDITSKIAEEQLLKKAEQDKAVAQGKYEIASEVLHDIGNAVVGFGTYLTRLSRLLDGNNQGTLDSIGQFLGQQRTAIAGAIGEAKADALVTMLTGISKTAAERQVEMQHAVSEQLRIIKHIQDILNIQRQYVLGHESQERHPVNLIDIIKDCQAMMSANFEKKGIRVTTRFSNPTVEIKGDRTKLMQVILNLLKNSVEAIDAQSPVKEIKIILSEYSSQVNLSITDTGKGITKDNQANLFIRGFTTRLEGTGLGLYNCRSIIESHSGTISIESEGEGSGSKTIIELNR